MNTNYLNQKEAKEAVAAMSEALEKSAIRCTMYICGNFICQSHTGHEYARMMPDGSWNFGYTNAYEHLGLRRSEVIKEVEFSSTKEAINYIIKKWSPLEVKRQALEKYEWLSLENNELVSEELDKVLLSEYLIFRVPSEEGEDDDYFRESKILDQNNEYMFWLRLKEVHNQYFTPKTITLKEAQDILGYRTVIVE